MKRAFWVTSVAVVLILSDFSATPALADTSEFNLVVGNATIAGSGATSPYVHVKVEVTTSGNATITFTAQSSYLMIDSGAIALNVNGTFSISGTTGFVDSHGVSINPNSNSCDLTQHSGGCQVDCFGNFNLVLYNGVWIDQGMTSLIVTLSGGSWGTSASSVLAANGNGTKAASHIAVRDGCTGYVGDASNVTTPPASTGDSCVSTPEPNSLVLLLASGLFGALIVLGRRV